ncbi:metal ABC transporter solute-binding protein, Zn/Mn family [Deinococcus pimensis]|uniref:metal ABC transporter solute-binding protein, Zn/Mn family n=1 Tax=Deinococcus pimensis TaxID=309888 RepID=UPI000A075769|nr:zinc ABC transporter substrate-binding protein [Deinococcus pimensis]
MSRLPQIPASLRAPRASPSAPRAAPRILGLGLLLTALNACAPQERQVRADLKDRPIRVTTTVNMITDLVRQVGGDRVEVSGLMGPGVDPHLYKASAGDVRRLANADVTFYGGLHLEGKMTDVLEKLGRFHPSHAVTERIPERRLRDVGEGTHDPHVWFDVTLWKSAATVVRDRLADLDPTHANVYRANADRYLRELDDLDRWITRRVNDVPRERRVMITAHDAFGYFGDRYGVEVRGLQGLSTTAEAGTRDVRALADFIARRRIRAVFVESSVPRRTVEAVQAAVRSRGHDLDVGGELYSDSAGAEGTPEGTYVGMVRHNVNTLVEALK